MLGCDSRIPGFLDSVKWKVWRIPVYSVLEGVEEVVESFSQSFSPFRLTVEGQEENPPADSGLRTPAYMTDGTKTRSTDDTGTDR